MTSRTRATLAQRVARHPELRGQRLLGGEELPEGVPAALDARAQGDVDLRVLGHGHGASPPVRAVSGRRRGAGATLSGAVGGRRGGGRRAGAPVCRGRRRPPGPGLARRRRARLESAAPGTDPAGCRWTRHRASPASLPEEQARRGPGPRRRPTRPGREGPAQPRTSGRAPPVAAARRDDGARRPLRVFAARRGKRGGTAVPPAADRRDRTEEGPASSSWQEDVHEQHARHPTHGRHRR